MRKSYLSVDIFAFSYFISSEMQKKKEMVKKTKRTITETDRRQRDRSLLAVVGFELLRNMSNTHNGANLPTFPINKITIVPVLMTFWTHKIFQLQSTHMGENCVLCVLTWTCQLRTAVAQFYFEYRWIFHKICNKICYILP